MSFSYNLESVNNINLLKVKGEFIEKEESNILLEKVNELISAGETKFIIDLGNIDYMNSTGLNVLINILTKSRKNGGDISLINTPKKVNDLFIMTKLNGIFNISKNMEEAEKSFSV